MIESFSTNGAFAKVISLNSSSVFQPSPSTRVPVLFSFVLFSFLGFRIFILEIFEANSLSNFFDSSLICSFSFSATSCQQKLKIFVVLVACRLSLVAFIFRDRRLGL